MRLEVAHAAIDDCDRVHPAGRVLGGRVRRPVWVLADLFGLSLPPLVVGHAHHKVGVAREGGLEVNASCLRRVDRERLEVPSGGDDGPLDGLLVPLLAADASLRLLAVPTLFDQLLVLGCDIYIESSSPRTASFVEEKTPTADRAVAVHPPSPPDISSSFDAAGGRCTGTETTGGSGVYCSPH